VTGFDKGRVTHAQWQGRLFITDNSMVKTSNKVPATVFEMSPHTNKETFCVKFAHKYN